MSLLPDLTALSPRYALLLFQEGIPHLGNSNKETAINNGTNIVTALRVALCALDNQHCKIKKKDSKQN